jgi:hypothetical protein
LVELTNNQFDQFDEVEIREVSYFGAVPMNFESGRPALDTTSASPP